MNEWKWKEKLFQWNDFGIPKKERKKERRRTDKWEIFDQTDTVAQWGLQFITVSRAPSQTIYAYGKLKNPWKQTSKWIKRWNENENEIEERNSRFLPFAIIIEAHHRFYGNICWVPMQANKREAKANDDFHSIEFPFKNLSFIEFSSFTFRFSFPMVFRCEMFFPHFMCSQNTFFVLLLFFFVVGGSEIIWKNIFRPNKTWLKCFKTQIRGAWFILWEMNEQRVAITTSVLG